MLICCEGDIGKVAQQLASEESLKAIAFSTITAGVTAGVGSTLGVPQAPHSFGDHLCSQALKAGVNGTVQIIQGNRLEDALLTALPGFALGTLGAMGAETLGDAHSKGDISALSHTGLHGGLGAALGASLSLVTGKDVVLGALSGATGAIVAEKVAEALDKQDSSPETRMS